MMIMMTMMIIIIIIIIIIRIIIFMVIIIVIVRQRCYRKSLCTSRESPFIICRSFQKLSKISCGMLLLRLYFIFILTIIALIFIS